MATNTHRAGRNAVTFGLAPKSGTFAVAAMADGKIQYSANPKNGVVYIDHQNGYCTVYMHLEVGSYPKDSKGQTMKDGASIAAGATLAKAGMTEANVIHLHAVLIAKGSSARCPAYDPKKAELPMKFEKYGVIGAAKDMNSGTKVTK